MGIHVYAGILISEELKQVREKFLSYFDEDIQTIVAIALTLQENRKKIKAQFKQDIYTNKESKLSYLIDFCYRPIGTPISKQLRLTLDSLPQKHFTKQEIADKKLPGLRNMLKEFTQRLTGSLEYYRSGLASKIVHSFLRKEKDQLKEKIKLAIESFISQSAEYQKMDII